MENSTELVTKGQQPAHRRIFEGLRHQILSGKFTPGTQLPGAQNLAAAWKTSTFTIHTALRALAKEGWINRRPNAGTYIADPRNRFLCVGVYHGGDITLDTATSFSRNLHFCLLNQLERLGKKSQVFIDSRPEEKQDKILPDLKEALVERRIQCVIAPWINRFDDRYLARLPVPTAFLGNLFSPNRVEFDLQDFFRGSLRQLAAEGCHSVGLITNLAQSTGEENFAQTFFRFFRQALAETGLVTRDEWVQSPSAYTNDFEAYGYQAFKDYWKLGEKPDGLIVYPDSVARGLITAVLEIGIRVVPRKMKFLFHRNAQARLLCPFQVSWAILDENAVAHALIELIQRQFNGETNSPILLPYAFTADPIDNDR